jgi:hypothetical protein
MSETGGIGPSQEGGKGPRIQGHGPLNEGMLRSELAKAGIHATDDLIAKAKEYVDGLQGEGVQGMIGSWYVLFGSSFVLVINNEF